MTPWSSMAARLGFGIFRVGGGRDPAVLAGDMANHTKMRERRLPEDVLSLLLPAPRAAHMKVSDARDLGSHLVASRDLKAGELVCVEHAVVVATEDFDHCGWCFRKCRSKCRSCRVLGTCGSDECEIRVNRFHQGIECRLFAFFKERGVWDQLEDVRLACSILRLLFLRHFERLYETPSLLFPHIVNLDALPRELQYFTIMANRDISLLIQYIPEDFLPPNPEQALLALAEILHTNSYSLFREGMGLFVFCSSLNHSCAPNVSHVNQGGTQMQVRAIRDIVEGEQLTTDYGVEEMDPCWRRIAKLYCERGWICHCPRCLWWLQKSKRDSKVDMSIDLDVEADLAPTDSFLELFLSGIPCECGFLVAPRLNPERLCSLSDKSLLQLREAVAEDMCLAFKILFKDEAVFSFFCPKCSRTSSTAAEKMAEALDRLAPLSSLVQTQCFRAKFKLSVDFSLIPKLLELQRFLLDELHFHAFNSVIFELRSIIIDYLKITITFDIPEKSLHLEFFQETLKSQAKHLDKFFGSNFSSDRGLVYECMANMYRSSNDMDKCSMFLEKAKREFEGLWGTNWSNK